ncbi:glycosyltransferase family 4 protein [Priestia megaterium]|uniref:glycosyltransferase family 4 protein n=1 Tax=Priestia TaxID=2800373 RepID=UPI000BFCD6A8|nr:MULTISPECIES: glycosyltransferase family 4 protein [Priestia]MDR4216141.1 glycosyltransferase family 4 protein [Priestia megaterium]MDR4217738.1 glycosyltransferase family 4 protein [Priestia megaterium]PGH73690.1 glycosyltransferase family 1 protein [Priestia megaterium]PGO38563.1 glycosyltransferase family 1 protein [Priestia megaterium]WJX01669.1 glycosyltransferase family 4 protein [Priestia aryabhattai]
MSNKVLFCATVDFHFKAFHLPYMKWFKEQGWEVHVAASGNMKLPYVDQKYNISIQRSPFHMGNMKSYRELKTVINENKYNIIHCHTPMGGVLARLAARKARKQGTKVIYTAHGFHFCKGAPLVNWLFYYPIEKTLARYTDCLITINQEDYQLATQHFKAKRIEHVHGVGINTENFKPANEKEKIQLKKSFGYRPDDFLLFYAAEFNKNKNQQLLLQSLALIKDEIPHAKLLLAGKGPLLENCRELAANLGIFHMVEFLGYRNDLQKIVPMCDVAVASSLREGLPVNIMEAMACGLPVVALDNRGHRELVHNNKNGWVIDSASRVEFASKIKVLAKIEGVKHKLGINGRDMILNKYSIDKVLIEKSRIYKSYTEETEGVKWAIH